MSHFWARCLISCVVELAIAEMACVSRNIRTAVPAAYGIPVQRSISERDGSYPDFNISVILCEGVVILGCYNSED